jgi:2-methylcitrate dehydratase PrpD
MVENLDYSEFPIMITSFKPYACCKYNHSPIEAVLSTIKANSIDYHDIEEITIDVCSMALRAIVEPREIKYNPPSVVGAQFSLPFSAAVAAVRGRAFIEEYTEEMLHNPEVRDMMKKVKIVHTAKMDAYLPKAFAAIATIRLKNGKEFGEFIEFSKGDPENPLTLKDVEEKFSILAKLNIESQEKIESIIKTVYNLEKLAISDLSRLL